MDVSQTGSPTSFGGAARPASTSAQGNASISSDFETFLKMLTVQMQNQDPMNPIESSDYAVQLATFSGVEQQVRTNDLLKAVQAQLGVMSMSDLVGWVGMEARATTPAHFDLAPVDLTVDHAPGSTSAFVLVRNADKQQVDRFEVSVAEDTAQWAGLDQYGTLLPSGDYTFHLQSYNANGLLSDEQMAVYSKVIEAKAENGETILVLESGAEVAASTIDGLRGSPS